MLRDDSNNGPSRRPAPRNVLGEPLEACSIKPMTGFYRDGCCNTGREDVGSHTVCAVMTSAFLEFSKSHGNDLSTPVPQLGFPGLKPGDRQAAAIALKLGRNEIHCRRADEPKPIREDRMPRDTRINFLNSVLTMFIDLRNIP